MTEPTQANLPAQEKLLPAQPAVSVQAFVEVKEPDTAAAAAGSPGGTPPTKKSGSGAGKLVAVACCGSITALAFLAIAAAVPITQIVIGWRYADQCPVNWRIPHYSFIAGILGLVVIVLAMIQAVLTIVIAAQAREENNNTKVFVGATIGLCGISIVVIFLVIFLLGWFIAGCIWVFSAWNRVQYNDPEGANYCHSVAYRVTFWLLIFSIAYYLYSCCRSSSQAAAKKRGAGSSV